MWNIPKIKVKSLVLDDHIVAGTYVKGGVIIKIPTLKVYNINLKRNNIVCEIYKLLWQPR